jgi:hypothetical protein
MASIVPFSLLAAMTSPTAPIPSSKSTPITKIESQNSCPAPSSNKIKPLNTVTLRRYLLQLLAFSYKIEFEYLAFALLGTELDAHPDMGKRGSSILTAEEQLHLLEISKTVARVYAHVKLPKAASAAAISNSEKMVVRNIVHTAQSIGISASHTLRHLTLYEKHRCCPSKRREYTAPHSSSSRVTRGLWIGNIWNARKNAKDLVSDEVFVGQVAPNEHTRMVFREGVQRTRQRCVKIKVERKVHKREKWFRVVELCKREEGEEESMENVEDVTREMVEREKGDKEEKKKSWLEEENGSEVKRADENGKGENENTATKHNRSELKRNTADDEIIVNNFEIDSLLEEYSRTPHNAPESSNPFEDPRFEYESSEDQNANRDEETDKDRVEPENKDTRNTLLFPNTGKPTTTTCLLAANVSCGEAAGRNHTHSESSDDESETDSDVHTGSTSSWEDYVQRTRPESYLAV